MPAKSICPECGQKYRSASHICIPSAVERVARRRRALEQIQSK